jgi:hypothetical protein
MAGITKPINTVNGWLNLGTALRTAGYGQGAGLSLTELKILNLDATNLAYIHLTDQGPTVGASPAGLTGTDGWPIGVAAGNAGNSLSLLRGSSGPGVDANQVWIFASAVFAIKVLAFGT